MGNGLCVGLAASGGRDRRSLDASLFHEGCPCLGRAFPFPPIVAGPEPATWEPPAQSRALRLSVARCAPTISP